METLAPIPKVGEVHIFYADDLVKQITECEARILDVYEYKKTADKYIYKYDSYFEEVVPTPLMDLWLEAKEELFWILADETDFIIETRIDDLCPYMTYFARDLDGGWHAFETHSVRQFGFLDITKENYNKLHQVK